ncbi:unnamed protein product [Thelazia callipaeda]|uniref:L-glutamate gamma-semialdehyde dehydrogenase n=1 Tax=Thelazia callipaeda TaxID=103827 RepID=A0A0N5D3D3_THECL|nr:unnamed protein product [Thelazia callipaeda]
MLSFLENDIRYVITCKVIYFAKTYFVGTGVTSEKFMRNAVNEPVLTYQKGSVERIALEKAVSDIAGAITNVPLVIGKEKIFTNLALFQPSDHQKVIARFAHATSEQIEEAIRVGLNAKQKWERKPLRERADVLLHAADLCAGKYRMKLNAATMLGQGKNIVQAEIDSACELVDFFRFNAKFALDAEKYQPISLKNVTNTMILRSLEGFVAAVAPFNFTAISGNLATAPALMGNAVLWKPACTAVLSNYFIYEALEEAGLPPGVISFLPSRGPVFGDAITSSPFLSAINFTGSVPTFKYLWKKVAENLDTYISFPRLIGECGGKNFHFIHPSADLDTVAPCTIRAAYEYQGQKCSACSRIYVPESLWPTLQAKLESIQKEIKVGDVRDGSVFMTAVIDEKAFKSIRSYIDYAKTGKDGAKIIFGGSYDDTKGYFIQPTLIQVDNWDSKLLTEVHLFFLPVYIIVAHCIEYVMTIKNTFQNIIYSYIWRDLNL